MRSALIYPYYYSGGSEALRLVNAFNSRVTADGGTFESSADMVDLLDDEIGSYKNQFSWLVTPNGYKASKLYALYPADGSGDMAFVRANAISVRQNASRVIETMATDVPRITHEDSDSPQLLLEPARTNLLLRSEELDNASWTKLNSSISANATTAPNGTSTADKIVENSSAGVAHGVRQDIAKAGSALSYIYSVSLKAAERTWARITITDGGANGYTGWFDLSNGGIGGIAIAGTGFSVIYHDIVPEANGWYRCFFGVTSNTLTTLGTFVVAATGDLNTAYNGDGASGIYTWGHKLIQSTSLLRDSYIPTTTASVARSADLVTTLNNAALLGQTQGTLVLIVKTANDGISKNLFFISDNTANNRIGFLHTTGNVFQSLVVSGGVTQASISNTAFRNYSYYKLLITYQANKVAFFINGTKIGEDLTATIPACSYIGFNAAGVFPAYGNILLAGHIKTALSDADAAILSTTARTFDNFISRVPVRESAYILASDATYKNVCPGGIITDPLDSSNLLFYRGEFTGSTSVAARIRLYTASQADPFNLSLVGTILSPSEAYDINGCRFGFNPVSYNGVLYYFYVGIDASYNWKICLATSADSGRTFTKQGIVLTPNGTDEFGLSGPSAVIGDDGKWYMVCTVWSGPVDSVANHNPGTSSVGVKLFESSDQGSSWTYTGIFIARLGASGSYDDAKVEDGQLMKIGDTYIYSYSCNDGSKWQSGLAYSKVLKSTFKKTASVYFPSTSAFGNAVVAVLQPFQLNDGSWVGYYQGADSGDPADTYPIGGVTFEIQ